MVLMSDVVVDSSFLFALFNASTTQHEHVIKVSRQIRGQFIVVQVVLTEVTFLFYRSGGVPAVSQFLTAFVSSNPTLEAVVVADLLRARDIMNAYPRAKLDFVDCCLTAVAERLNIVQIATLDRRDFQIIRPKHCDLFDLIP